MSPGRLLLFGPDRKTPSNPYPKWRDTVCKTQDRLKEGVPPPHQEVGLFLVSVKTSIIWCGTVRDNCRKFV